MPTDRILVARLKGFKEERFMWIVVDSALNLKAGSKAFSESELRGDLAALGHSVAEIDRLITAGRNHPPL